MPEKLDLHHPESYIGKRIDPNKWQIPEGFVLCRKTGKLVREQDALVTFCHWAFDRQWLLERNIYIEDADWLTEEGYEEIVDVLKNENQYDNYIHRVFDRK